MLAGAADGIRNLTYKPANTLAHGVARTGEGLHLAGSDAFDDVGSENFAAYDFTVTLLEKVINFELDVMENPIMQIVTFVINEYASAIPEWLVKKLLEDGSIDISDGLDKVEVMKAVQYGVIKGISAADVDQVAPFLERRAMRTLGSQLTKKMMPVIAACIATKIAKNLFNNRHETLLITRQLAAIRRQIQPLGGGSAKILMSLLKAQGMLGIAARDSRRLRSESTVLWEAMRLRMGGADMIYFLVRPMIQEFVDRISLLEKNPTQFAQMIKALVQTKDANSIYLLGH